MQKFIYLFGGSKNEGTAGMKNLLGGKGANLAEMGSLGIPVPPGFTLTTEMCTYYYANKKKYPQGFQESVLKAVRYVEKETGMKFGDKSNPLLFSVRSGARSSMPGMMETVLNVGLTTETREGLAQKTGNPRFVYDSHRRLIQMYSDVVMEKAAGREPGEGQGIRQQLEREMHKIKAEMGYKLDTDLSAEDLKQLIEIYKAKVKQVLGIPFPDDPVKQLLGAISAVFSSWNGRRAVAYRRIEGIPDEWGTAVNVQAMVFGNMGETSATGVAFTRNPSTGDPDFYGEWLPNAQGEDVVAGIRTPNPINEATRSEHSKGLPSLEQAMPKTYKELDAIQRRLEKHYRDMLDIEFTIQEGRLWMLQCRVGKRNGPAAVKMAVDMLKEKMISKEEAVERVSPSQLGELLHPILDPAAERSTVPIAKGLPAGPGGACGQIVFSANDAVGWAKTGNKVILVREETNPEDIEGMRVAVAVLTARGGMTSHAALVARGWGKCCIVGAGSLHIDAQTREISVGERIFKEGDWFSMNGSIGYVYEGQVPMKKAAEDNPSFLAFMKICDMVRILGVRTNADTPDDAVRARAFGAEGIGLFRIEHMFYGKGSEEPLFKLRKMIVSGTEKERRSALDELFPFCKSDIKGTLKAMNGLPVTIRTMDPPLHEFIPTGEEERDKLAESMGISKEEFDKRANALHESNPMMGHRGVRLGITYPEITEMQIRAIFEAAAELLKEGAKPLPEIMIPVVCVETELKHQQAIVETVYRQVLAKFKLRKIPYLFGTMIEIPRATLVADKIAAIAQFFSYGTNDLTQMSFGFSRDDVGGFLTDYIQKKIIPEDPFATIDTEGVGHLVQYGIGLGRSVRPNLKIGVCGEHGGDPVSVKFFARAGVNYVSCSPFRVPIARLSAAQAAIEIAREKAATSKPTGKPTSKPSSKTKAAKQSVLKRTPAKKNAGKRPKK